KSSAVPHPGVSLLHRAVLALGAARLAPIAREWRPSASSISPAGTAASAPGVLTRRPSENLGSHFFRGENGAARPGPKNSAARVPNAAAPILVPVLVPVRGRVRADLLRTQSISHARPSA